MNKYLDNYIRYKSQHIFITLGLILLILAHFIHLVYKKDIFVFQILFIISYIILIIGIVIEKKKINIMTLINKVMIIILVSLGIYYDYNKLNNN
jgi:intracellular septation protein A